MHPIKNLKNFLESCDEWTPKSVYKGERQFSPEENHSATHTL